MEKILIVNNDMDTMSLLKTWLEKKDYKVKYSGNEVEVAHLMASFHPDMVLIDSLQGDIAKKIRLNKPTSEVPILLMTGFTLREQYISMAYVDDVVEKPFDLTVLEQKIEALITKIHQA